MSECKVEIKIAKGKLSLARADGIRINGREIPNVVSASIRYTANDARRVFFELLPTDVVEVDEADW